MKFFNRYLDSKKYVLELLFLALGFFPLLKTATLSFSNGLVFHYVFIFSAVSILAAENLLKKNKVVWLLNLFILFYCVIAYAHQNYQLVSGNLKVFAAAFVYTNLIYIFYQLLKSDQRQFYLEKYIKYLFLSSVLFLTLLLISFIVLFLRFPIEVSWNEIKNMIMFSRSQDPQLRLDLILRLSVVGLLRNSITSVSYIGPQLLITPFVFIYLYFSKIISFRYFEIKKVWISLFLVLFTFCVLVTNSRAFALAGLFLLIFRFFKFEKNIFLTLSKTAAIIFPFAIYGLPVKVLSNRSCTAQFVLERISLFGNGISYDVDSLNKSCIFNQSGTSLDMKFLALSFDNVHLELLHYFGILIYILVIPYILLKLENRRSSYFFIFFIFIFMSLNFNLFEVVLVPLTVILSSLAYEKRTAI